MRIRHLLMMRQCETVASIRKGAMSDDRRSATPVNGRFTHVSMADNRYKKGASVPERTGMSKGRDSGLSGLLQFGVFSLGLDQQRHVGIGVFPERHQVLVLALGGCGVASHGQRARQVQPVDCVNLESRKYRMHVLYGRELGNSLFA